MPPPPATSVASRLFLGPALRAQPDWRLVSLVRNGYESAFDEIVRRYGTPLGRYAAAIVPSSRAEDVTQDAFSKALLALRYTDKEIELRPWLYRIVRNTALNDLRDQPPASSPLHEGIDGVETPPEAAERREEVAELMRRLRALPDPQRAAIVMRELEGLSHEEIAGALGLTGGGARQAIYRARRALRDGVGMLVPLPVLHHLLDPGVGDAVAGAGVGGAAAASAAGATAGGAGTGMAMKAGLATVLVAGSVGTGVALHNSSRGESSASASDASSLAASDSRTSAALNGGPGDRGQSGGPGSGDHGAGSEQHGHSSGHGSGSDDTSDGDSHGGPGPSSGGGSHEGSSQGGSGGDESGHHGGGSGTSGDGSGTSGDGSGTSGGGSGSGGSDDGSSGGGGDTGSGGDDGGSGGGGDSSTLPPPPGD